MRMKHTIETDDSSQGCVPVDKRQRCDSPASTTIITVQTNGHAPENLVNEGCTYTTYQYQPVDTKDGIRLLVLEPNEHLESPVKCSLIHSTLTPWKDDLIEHYTALSYVWVDAEITTPLLIDGKVLNVTVNLEAALRYMRDATRKRLVWADAICINQSDDEEKSHQVSRMNEVYAHAKHTVIFLGDPTEETELVLKSLRSESSSEILNSLSYGELFTRPWFKRIWVLQELISSRDPWVQCGRQRIRWDKLYTAATKSTERPKRGGNLDWETFFHMADERKRVRDTIAGPGLTEPYADVLLETLDARRALGCFDPRDMLFAHHAILGRASGSNEDQKLIEVNYKKPCGDVYADIARYIICCRGTHNQRFEILSHIESLNRVESPHNGIPSWAPDWTLPGLRHPYCRLRKGLKLIETISWGDLTPDNLWYPDRDLPQPSHTWIGSSIFAVFGFSAGTILNISRVVGEAEVAFDLFDDDSVARFNESWTLELETLYEASDRYLARDAEHALWRGLYTSEQLWKYNERRFESQENFFLFATRELSLIDQLVYHTIADFRADTKYPRFLYGRRLALVAQERGVVLALVPCSAHIGDEICWFLDHLQLPYVIRSRILDKIESDSVDTRIRQSANARTEYEIKHFEFVGECCIEFRGEMALGVQQRRNWRLHQHIMSLKPGFFVLH